MENEEQFSSLSGIEHFEICSLLEEYLQCVDFVQIIDAFGEDDLKLYMRMKRETMDYIVERYSQSLESTSHGGRTKIDAKTTVYMYIWYMGNTVTFRQLGNLFAVSKSTARSAVDQVTACLIKLGHEFVKWPQGAAAEETQAAFQRRKGMPWVIGAIDCTHINIKAPTIGKERYYNRKQSYSLVLQAVVDENKRFIDVTCGEPGSLNDSRVLRRSSLYARAQSNYAELFPNGSFILGDSAYPSTNWLVPPFDDYGNLTEAKQNFNKIHSATRIVVENAFDMLKGRFQRLDIFTEQTNICTITNLVASACVLHNICILSGDLFNVNFNETDNSATSSENTSGEVLVNVVGDRREVLFNYLLEENII